MSVLITDEFMKNAVENNFPLEVSNFPDYDKASRRYKKNGMGILDIGKKKVFLL